MIVGTEGTQETEEVVDTATGKGSPRADAGKETTPKETASSPVAPGGSAGGAGGDAAGAGGSGGAGGGGNGGAAGGNAPGDDPSTIIARSQALADAMKPLETPAADLNDPVKRKAVEDAYAKAIGDNGDLRMKLNDAHKKFERAAADMKSGTALADWLKLLEKDQPIGKLLQTRSDLQTALTKKLGELEKKRADAQANAKMWADANANWAAPADKMNALIGQYADKIDKLNADINNDVNPNSAMLSFWFEVAPKHIQVDDQALSGDAQQIVDQVSAKLGGYGLADLLKSGKDRKDGSLYAVADSAQLTDRRTKVFDAWRTAAKALADAEADFKLQPDDAASQKQQFDKLKDDAWLQEAKKLPLDQPAS